MGNHATRNNRPCWKCGQQVRHYRPSFMRRTSGKYKGAPAISVDHLVEVGGHWTVCKGSGIAK